MKHVPNVLLVEGSNDKTFFENLCKIPLYTTKKDNSLK